MTSELERLLRQHESLQKESGEDLGRGFPLSEVREGILQFYQLLLKENEVQNLTRLTSPEDFYFGHFLDVWELIKSGFLDPTRLAPTGTSSKLDPLPVLDIGSGAGVPGLLTALMAPGSWVLSDSEGRKAEYLAKAADSLRLNARVKVFSGRAEDYLKNHSVSAVTARAVGPVHRIYAWIRNSSTWNKLILFKGPGWADEWARFQEAKFRSELKITEERIYQIGPDQKTRKIILLERISP